jgi:TetR/AcrR family transcriptional regulator, fatty acid metabolism regulator protein
MRTSDKHDKIIQAAIKVFADKGFFSARISDIAKKAHVADGTIYLYFNNKYDILLSLLEGELSKIIIEVKLLLEKETDPGKMLKTFAKFHLKLMEEKKDLAEILQLELRQSSQFIIEYRNTKFIEYIDIISTIIHKGQDQKIFRQDIMPGVFKRAYFGALDEMARLWILSSQPEYVLEEAADQISEIFLGGILTRKS